MEIDYDVFNKPIDVIDKHQLNVTYPSDNIFIKIYCNTMVLHENIIEMPYSWPNNNGKGIDDFMLSLR